MASKKDIASFSRASYTDSSGNVYLSKDLGALPLDPVLQECIDNNEPNPEGGLPDECNPCISQEVFVGDPITDTTEADWYTTGHSLAKTGKDGYFVKGSFQTLYNSTNILDWNTVGNPINTTYKTITEANLLTESATGTRAQVINALAIKGNTLVMSNNGYSYGGVQYSTDGGTTWTTVTGFNVASGVEPPEDNNTYMTSLELGGGYLYTCLLDLGPRNTYFYRSSDLGVSWHQILIGTLNRYGLGIEYDNGIGVWATGRGAGNSGVLAFKSGGNYYDGRPDTFYSSTRIGTRYFSRGGYNNATGIWDTSTSSVWTINNYAHYFFRKNDGIRALSAYESESYSSTPLAYIWDANTTSTNLPTTISWSIPGELARVKDAAYVAGQGWCVVFYSQDGLSGWVTYSSDFTNWTTPDRFTWEYPIERGAYGLGYSESRGTWISSSWTNNGTKYFITELVDGAVVETGSAPTPVTDMVEAPTKPPTSGTGAIQAISISQPVATDTYGNLDLTIQGTNSAEGGGAVLNISATEGIGGAMTGIFCNKGLS